MNRFFDLLKTKFPEGSISFKKDDLRVGNQLGLIEMCLEHSTGAASWGNKKKIA